MRREKEEAVAKEQTAKQSTSSPTTASRTSSSGPQPSGRLSVGSINIAKADIVKKEPDGDDLPSVRSQIIDEADKIDAFLADTYSSPAVRETTCICLETRYACL